ncbi:MAG TPA: ABC transporter substrate-binding protein [Wenzhouxiangellaceae bacterium]|nr:ABC transporter substrate-binding protein [Wenzhouxiangellaceae bacterium]
MIRFKMFPLVALLLLPVTALAQQERGPVEIVRETTNELFKLVDENREKYEDDVEALRDAIRPVLLAEVDTQYSGRLVLGRSARGMESAKVEEFADALSELLIRRYADGLLDFRTRDQVDIMPLAGDNTERMTRVKTRVTLENGEQAPVDYVFRKTGDGWKIFDVIVEGISYVTTFRNQIGEQIRQEGFDTMLEELKRGEIEIDVDEQ